jgi:hypothetical protein
MRRKILRMAAWVVTLAILGYLFWRVPIDEVVRALSNAAPWTAPAVVGLVLLVFLTDSLAMWKTFAWFVARLRFREVLTLRGATYLLAMVNYALGQGAIVYFVNRSRGVPIVRGAAAVLLIMGTNLLLLVLFSTMGIALGAEVLPELRVLIWAAYAALAAYVVVLAWKPRWLTTRPVFDVLLSAGLAGHVKALGVRLPHVLSLLLLNYVALHAFGVKVPVVQTVLCMPVVFLVAVLPISVQGLGPTQGAMIFFFARYAPGTDAYRAASVLAASLAAQVLAWCVQIVIGLLCLRSQLGHGLKELPKEMPAAS